MKKKICAFAFILSFAGGIAKADTTTTRLGLTKPTLSSTNWGPKLNTNADIIDTNVALISSTNSFTYYQTFSSGTFTDRLGVGGAPTNKFDVIQAAPSDTAVTSKITNTDSGYTVFIASANSTVVDIRAIGSGATGNWTTGIPAANLATIGLGTTRGLLSSGTTLYINTPTTDPIIYRVNNTEVGRMSAAGFRGDLFGKTDGSSPGSGDIGEFISSSTVSAPFGTSGQYKDLVAISLTAGTWLVSYHTCLFTNGATVTDSQIGIGTVSGNDATGLASGENLMEPGAFINGAGYTISPKLYASSGAQTLYLKIYATYSVATPRATGKISATRIY